jgi:hypothetical protein
MAMSPMNTSEIIQALTPLIEVFDRFGIAYLRKSAPMLGIADLLEKAFNDAGIQTA